MCEFLVLTVLSSETFRLFWILPTRWLVLIMPLPHDSVSEGIMFSGRPFAV